jgi:hypothetical protein
MSCPALSLVAYVALAVTLLLMTVSLLKWSRPVRGFFEGWPDLLVAFRAAQSQTETLGILLLAVVQVVRFGGWGIVTVTATVGFPAAAGICWNLPETLKWIDSICDRVLIWLGST